MWDVESQLLSRLYACSLGEKWREGKGGEGVRRAVVPPDRERFYRSTVRAVNQESDMGPEKKEMKGKVLLGATDMGTVKK